MRVRSERGATLVEGALVAPVFFFCVFLIVQSAFWARSYLSAEYGSTAGSRVGSVDANNAAADYDVIAAVKRAAVIGARNEITKIVVFDAGSADGVVPPECLNGGGQTGKCNVYTAADFNRPVCDFDGASSWTGDDYWAAPTRDISDTDGVGPAYLGVYVQVSAGGIGGPLPQSFSRTSASRLEPGLSN